MFIAYLTPGTRGLSSSGAGTRGGKIRHRRQILAPGQRCWGAGRADILQPWAMAMLGIIGMGTLGSWGVDQKTELSCLQHSCVSLKWQFNATCFVFCERWLAIRGESELTTFEAQNERCALCCLFSVAWVVYLFCRTRSVSVARRLICCSIYLG